MKVTEMTILENYLYLLLKVLQRLVGKYSLKLSAIEQVTGKKFSSVNNIEFTVYDAIKVAGGPTDEADLTAIPYYDIVKNGGYVFIPRRATDNEEERLEICRPFVEDEIKDYLTENNITNVLALRKLVHKKTIVSRVQKRIEKKNLNLSSSQIEGLIEKRIKELKYIRDGLNNATKEIKIADKAEIEAKETKSIIEDRQRQETGVKNAEEDSLDKALERLHALSNPESENEENESENIEDEKNLDLMNQLLNQLEEQKEKVLVSARNDSRQRNLNRLELNFDENSGKQMIRDEYTKNPDEMMNKILGRY